MEDVRGADCIKCFALLMAAVFLLVAVYFFAPIWNHTITPVSSPEDYALLIIGVVLCLVGACFFAKKTINLHQD